MTSSSRRCRRSIIRSARRYSPRKVSSPAGARTRAMSNATLIGPCLAALQVTNLQLLALQLFDAPVFPDLRQDYAKGSNSNLKQWVNDPYARCLVMRQMGRARSTAELTSVCVANAQS